MYETDYLHIPKELDWVTERANCTAYTVFKKLQLEVEKDVKARQSRIVAHEGARQIAFRFDVSAELSFAVLREGNGVSSAVFFRLDDETIIVRDGINHTVMSAGLMLNDAGECVLRVSEPATDPTKEVELRSWQFRRRALERLFFDIHPTFG